MPQLGETVTEGTITRWLKQVGDRVEADEPLFEVSTDKVDSEVPAPAAGALTEILVPEGETAEVGARLAVISDGAGAAGRGRAGGRRPAAPEPAPRRSRRPRRRPPSSGARAGARAAAPPPAPAPAAPAPCRAAPAPPAAPAAAGAPAAADHRRRPATGAAARRPRGGRSCRRSSAACSPSTASTRRRQRDAARAAGSPATTSSTPPPGRALGAGARPRRPPPTAPVRAPCPPPRRRPPPAARARRPCAGAGRRRRQPPRRRRRPTGDEVVPFDNIRRRTAEHMVRSKATSPHVYTSVEVDFERVDRARRSAAGGVADREGFSLTYLPFIVRAFCDTVDDYPNVNASVDGETLVVHHDVNLGIAVDLEFTGLHRAGRSATPTASGCGSSPARSTTSRPGPATSS